MKKLLLVVGLLLASSAAADLLACGDKFLVVSRGTRYQRAALARQPANILVYANPSSSLPKALSKAAADTTLRKAGYNVVSVSSPDELERTLRQGRWDLVVVDLADSAAIQGRLHYSGAPMVLPVAYNATSSDVTQARKAYPRIVKGPVKSQAFLEAVDEALALRLKSRA